VGASGGAIGTASRYSQYRLQLSTTAVENSPVVREVIVKGTS